jgi:hypothetical protein
MKMSAVSHLRYSAVKYRVTKLRFSDKSTEALF